jgi:hypothetical protein
LVELLIDRVIVTDGEVEIRYVIPTSPSSEHVRFCHLRSDYLHNPPVCRPNFSLLSTPFLAIRLLMPRFLRASLHLLSS